MRLDQLDAKLVESELLQGLRTLHSPVDVVETVGRIISTRALNTLVFKEKAYLG